MSKIQQQPSKQMAEHHQHQQPDMKCKNKKNKKGRRKVSGVSVKPPQGSVDNMAAVDDNIMEKKPLHDSKNQIKVAQTTEPTVSRKHAGSNWDAVSKAKQQEKLSINGGENVAGTDEKKVDESEIPKLTKSARRRLNAERYVAMDCEMVGVGVNGRSDMLARVTIVNRIGKVLLDKYVKPRMQVTDYRTSISGIRPHDINNGEDFSTIQDEVVELLQGKILVGHSVHKDLSVLSIKHPYCDIRDTARYKPLQCLTSNRCTPSLKQLSQLILDKEIQTGEHNSVEDARAVMSIYNCLSKDWEKCITARKRKQRK